MIDRLKKSDNVLKKQAEMKPRRPDSRISAEKAFSAGWDFQRTRLDIFECRLNRAVKAFIYY
jgi:hypothetical protein